MNKKILLSIVLLFSSLGAKDITITTSSYQQVVKKDRNGKIKKVWIKATKVVPGTTIKYVNVIKNNTNKAFSNVEVKNNIDPHLEYLKNSATSNNNLNTKFKTASSKEFLEPNKLFIIKNGKKRLALAKEYRAIKWNLKKLKPNSTITLEYSAKLK